MRDPDQTHDWRGRCEVLLLAALILLGSFALLGSRGLNEPDEGRYAEMSREMLESGDWLMPTLHGFPHPQKPPVIYWLIGTSFKLFGLNEWAARFPSALAAAGTAWLTFIAGRRLFGARAGIAATAFLLTSLEFFVLARMLTPDMVLTFWITAAITAFVLWTCHSERRHWLWLSFAAMGAGFFTKGPMAIVVPVSAVAAWQIAHKRRGKPAKIPWLRGMMLTFVLGLSWFVVVAIKEPGLFHFFAHDELLARFFTKQHGRYHSPLFFIPVILGGLLPWTILLPALVRWLVNEGKTQRGLPPAWWLLIGWVVPPFLVLSLSGSKLITYVLPLYPALALALGAWWDQNGSRRSLTWPAVGVVGLFAGLTVALVAATRFAPHLVPEVPLLVMGTLSLVVLAMGAMVVPPTPQPSLLGGGFVGGAMAIWLLLLSQASSWNDVMGTGASMRSLAQRIGHHRVSMPTVFVYGVNVPGLEWYLRQLVYISKDRADDVLPMTAVQQARLVSSPQQCADLPALGRPVFGVVKLSKVGSDWPTNTWRLVATAGRFALIQRIEVDSQPPPKP